MCYKLPANDDGGPRVDPVATVAGLRVRTGNSEGTALTVLGHGIHQARPICLTPDASTGPPSTVLFATIFATKTVD